MNENNNRYCNLCLKSFNEELFFSHIPSIHFAQSEFTCEQCNGCFNSPKKLHDHYNSQHAITNGSTNLFPLKFTTVFTNSKDLIRHTRNSADWIRTAFSLNPNNAISKREMRMLIIESYNQKIQTNTSASVCNVCEKGGVVCFYCVSEFPNTCHLKQHLLNTHLQLPDNYKAVVNFCDICNRVFPCDDQLRKHRKCEHSSSVGGSRCELKEKKKKKRITPKCDYCNKTLANVSNLKRHLVNTHGDLMGTSPASKVLYTCEHCKCHFSNKSSIKRHIENLHLKEKETRKSISCFQCEQRFNSIKNLNSYLAAEHQIQIQERKIQFTNLDGFWEWKQNEELRTNARYIQLRGLRRQRRNGEEISTLKFVCNRSGIFHSKSNGKRAYRIKGSSKIGRYCSAFIEISFTDSVVECIYCSTHSGHENDLRYLALTMNEKKEIYEKIKYGATFSSILNEIRNNVGKEIKRKHLVTNKDLHNIVTTFKKLTKPSTEYDEPNSNSPNSYVAGSVVEIEKGNSLRMERNYNHDLDISADLWVETCQRIVNQFDPSMSLIPSKNDNVMQKTNSSTMEPSESVFGRSTETIYTNTEYALGEASINFPSPHPVLRTDMHDYTSTEKVIHPTSENAAKIVDLDSDYFAMTNTTNHTSLEHDELPNAPMLIPANVDSQIEDRINSSSLQTLSTSSNTFDISAISDNDQRMLLPPANTNNEISDLRDRVNSVTALYNIVESELDERKKKLIRNYVDNMFKVLQYRHNKCKSTKNSTKRPRQRPSIAGKYQNSGRRNGRTEGVVKKAVRALRLKKTIPKIHSRSTTYRSVSKNSNSRSNGASDSVITNLTSESNISSWQY